MFCSDVKESWVLIEGDWRVGERERERESAPQVYGTSSVEENTIGALFPEAWAEAS